MKALISILMGLLVVGCGKTEPLGSGSEYNAGLAMDQNTTKAEPAKELSLEEKVVGAYKSDGHKGNVDKAGNKLFEYGMDLLNDGTFVHYMNGEKTFEGRWEIKGNEIHQILEGDMVAIYRLNPDMSLTNAESLLGKTLLKIPEDKQYTYTKITLGTDKTPSKSDGKRRTKAKSEPAKKLTLKERAVLKERTVGAYEYIIDGDTYRDVFLENGIAEGYKNDKKEEEANWSISKEGEIHAEFKDGFVVIGRINLDGSITAIAVMKDGVRTYLPKDEQRTAKKIKPETKETPSKGDDNNSTTARPVKELTAEEKKALRDSIVGEYEFKGELTERFVLLDNGIAESSNVGKIDKIEVKWKISKEGEIHTTFSSSKDIITVWRVNKDRSITAIAMIKDGKRSDRPKIYQRTYKKIK